MNGHLLEFGQRPQLKEEIKKVQGAIRNALESITGVLCEANTAISQMALLTRAGTADDVFTWCRWRRHLWAKLNSSIQARSIHALLWQGASPKSQAIDKSTSSKHICVVDPCHFYNSNEATEPLGL